MSKKLSGKALEEHENGRDIWQEVLDSIKEIKSGGGKRYTIDPKTPAAKSQADRRAFTDQVCRASWCIETHTGTMGAGASNPSGAAKTLIKIAQLHPESLRDISVE